MFSPKPVPVEQLPVGLWANFRRQMPGYAAGMFFLALYQLLQYFFDNRLDDAVDAAVKGESEAVLRFGLVLVLIAAASFGARVLSRVLVFNGGRNAEYELRRLLLHRLHSLGQSFYSRMPTGDIMSRVTNDLTQVRLLLGFGVLNLLGVVFSLVSSLAVLVERSVKLTLASLSVLPLLVLVVVSFSKKMFTLQRQNQEAMGKLSTRVQSSIAGVRVVRAFGLEKFEREQFDDVNELYLDRSLKLARLRGTMWPIMEAMSNVGMVVLLWYGGYLVIHDESFDAGSFVAFFRALSRLTWPLISLGFMISVIERGRASYERVHEVLLAKPDIVGGEQAIPEGPLHLQVKGLNFSYGSRQILSDVGFELRAGESVAIVGRTGSGKSTLAQLLARVQPTPRGSVSLNGVDVCDLPLLALRGNIGYAQQEPFLFSTTVGRNLGYVLDDPESADSVDVVRTAARESQILDEVLALPDGFDTVVGERGVQLSGGQKQRISLGRALVSEPKILVLDDPMSAVDGRTETAILEAVDRQRSRRSVVLITHRISAARRCDRVLVLDQGRIVEQGTPAELEAAGGLYSVFSEEQRIETELAVLNQVEAEAPVRLVEAEAHVSG